MSRAALTGRTPAVGDSGATAAAAGPPPRLALSAIRAHGGELVLRGYLAAAFGNPVYGVNAVEEADRMLCELAVRGHPEVSLQHGRLPYALWERDAPP